MTDSLGLGSAGSVLRHGVVDLRGPGIDAAGEVIDARVAALLQECDDLRAAHAVVADTDDRLRGADLVQTLRDVVHGDVDGGLAGQVDARKRHFPGFAHVQQQGLRLGADEGPFDLIVLSGSVPDVPRALLQQLKPGGRLAAVVGELPIMRARLYTRAGTDAWSQADLFDTVAPRLEGFDEPTRFHF